MNAPNVYWEKFFSKFNEIESLPIKEWKEVHLISYFCKKYKDYYNLDYTFKFDNSPSKSYEVFQIKKLQSMITTDPEILKKYIDWSFSEKIKERKQKVTVIGFLVNIKIVNDFKFKYLGNTLSSFDYSSITRSSELTNNILDLVKKYNLDISTFGHLCFLDQMNDPTNENLFNDLNKIGITKEFLSKIK